MINENIDLSKLLHWNLEDGIVIAQELELRLIPLGAHCALGGSVLHKGFSDKDLDIFIYAHRSSEPYCESEILEMLRLFGVKGLKEVNHKLYGDDKKVYYSYYRSQRIDFFFL